MTEVLASICLKLAQYAHLPYDGGGMLCLPWSGEVLGCQGHSSPASLQPLAELGTKAALNRDWEVAFWLFGDLSLLMC